MRYLNKENESNMETVKINSLEFESVKRIKAVALEPSENGLTVIGGRNGQGKTSVLDAICWALGGDRFKPSDPKRFGDYNDPHLKVTLSNGIVVERKGKNSDLKVTDATGKKSGQTLLNSFIGELALDLPRFMSATGKEKAHMLLGIIGLDNILADYEEKETKLYNERYAVGRFADQKNKFANELPYYDGVPQQILSASDLISKQQEILAVNGENRRKRARLSELTAKREKLIKELSEVEADLAIASADASELEDRSTEELEKSIAEIDAINVKVRANMARSDALLEAAEMKNKYDELTAQLNTLRDERLKLLEDADLPLPELSVEKGELTYKGLCWDCLSGAEQLKVATSIVRKLKPGCGFVLLDKLEQMDTETLADFGRWLQSEGLQVIATRVSTGDECSVIIEDGKILETEMPKTTSKWTKGEF